jgi:hypothetical protein
MIRVCDICNDKPAMWVLRAGQVHTCNYSKWIVTYPSVEGTIAAAGRAS